MDSIIHNGKRVVITSNKINNDLYEIKIVVDSMIFSDSHKTLNNAKISDEISILSKNLLEIDHE